MTEQGSALPPEPLVRLFSAANVWLYRASAGRLGATIKGAPVLLLTVAGRRSGKKRTLPVVYITTERGHALIASKGGAPRHPAWYLNLEAAREAEIQIGRRRSRVRVEIVDPASPRYAELWQKGLALYPDYADYKTRTARVIPIVELVPET
jgi:deazaflavin-dependent oxidoreductase (nitroreductase family)